MTTEAIPAAGEPAPAAAAPAPAAAPAAAVQSLIPETVAAAPAAAPAAKPAAVDPNSPNAWVLAEGVLGNGERPAWYKADKYKSVADQAAAYPELEKRFGAFVGAPKDGKYEFKPPEGVGLELVAEHPLLTDFQKWAAENQLSQDGYQHIVGMLAQYEAQNLPDMAVIKTELGANADARINAVAQWGKANLSPEAFASLREATSGRNAAAVFKAFEAAIAKTQQPVIPKPGQETAAAQPNGLAGIRAAQAKLGPDGKTRLWDSDPSYRVRIEQMYADYYSNQAA